MMYYGDRDVDCVSKLMEEEFSRLRAYCFVYPLSQHAPSQFWEYEQPYIDNIILNAHTFARRVVQWYFGD